MSEALAPAPPVRSRLVTLGRDPYVVVATLLAVGMAFQTLDRQWSTDFWIHAATVEWLRGDLFDPSHALVGTDDPFELNSPYALVLATAARLSRLDTVVVLQAAALANLVLFLVGFRLFVLELTGRASVAAGALVATLVFWGWEPWRWSGFLNLNSIGFGLPYPSMFSTGLLLVAAWCLLRYTSTAELRWVVALALLATVIALSHPFTAVWGAILLGALTIDRLPSLWGGPGLILVLAGAGAAVLALAWPYYPLLGLIDPAGGFQAPHELLYERVLQRSFCALPGLVVLVRRARHRPTDPLVVSFVVALALYGAGYAFDVEDLGRFLPLVLLPLHVAVGVLLADGLARLRRRPVPRSPWVWLLVVWVAISGLVGLAGVVPGTLRVAPRAVLPAQLAQRAELQPITAGYDALGPAGERVNVVVAETVLLGRVAPAFGIAVVNPLPTPFVGDVGERRAAARRLLDSRTRLATRREVAERYAVDAVLCASDRCRAGFAGGSVVASGPGWQLIELPAGLRSPAGG